MTQSKEVTPLFGWQRQLIAVAWITYAAYYLGRVNLSAALPDIGTSLSLSKTELGLLGTGFFWAYAVGQLINGQLGDIVSPRRLVFWGMVASSILNVAFGLSSLFWLMLLFWSLNGYFQATGWGPVLRTLANWLTEKQTRRVSTVFGTCFVAGNAISVVFAGWLVERYGWRTAFWVPALLMLLLAAAWYALVRDTPEAAGHQLERAHPLPPKRQFELQKIIQGLVLNFKRFWSLGIAAVFVGFILVSLAIWLPTYYVDVGNLPISTASALSALVPLAGVAGVIVIGRLVNRYLAGRETFGLLIVLGILAILFLIYPLLPIQLVVSTIALMVIGAFISGASNLTLTTLPLVLGDRDEASGTAGLIDFSINIGAGMSTAVIGAILERLDWNAVFFALMASAVIAALFVWITVRQQ